MKRSALVIRDLDASDIAPMAAAFIAMGCPDRTATLERYFREQQAGSRPMFVAFSDGEFAGYVTVAWQSSYEHFAAAGIPEIKDLNVIEPFRRRKIATALVQAAETSSRPRPTWWELVSACTPTMAPRSECTLAEATRRTARACPGVTEVFVPWMKSQ